MSDYEKIQKKRDTIVGVFVVVALMALFWMVLKFGDLPLIVGGWKSFQVIVQFPTATGVQENTPVRFCGYQIGQVTEVKPPEVLEDKNTHQFYHQTVVVLNIDKRYDDIPKDVEVKLMTRGLGSSYIELKLPSFDVKEPQKEVLVRGSLLQGSAGMTSEFFPEESQKKLEQLVDGIDALVANANDILGDKENKENLKATLANMTEATEQATHALKQFQEFSAVAVDTGESLSETLDSLQLILDRINTGEGSAARIINDGRLYENLLENTRQLEVLLEELRLFLVKANQKGVPIKLK